MVEIILTKSVYLSQIQYGVKVMAYFKKRISILLRFSPFFPIDNTGSHFSVYRYLCSYFMFLHNLLSKPDLSHKCQIKIYIPACLLYNLCTVLYVKLDSY